LGNFLYEYYSQFTYVDSRGRPFEDNFLDYDKVRVVGDEIEFISLTEAQGFTLIDTWTRAWVDIQNSYFENPAAPGQLITPIFLNSLPSVLTGVPLFPLSRPTFSDTRPGYSTSIRRFVYLQSKKAYRYQPGRISGFTFGAKASTDAGSNQNIIEWGIANPTDQYVFQIQGASFSIVRRSTVPLNSEVISASGLNPNSQTLEPSGDPYNSTNYYTLKIPREFFNGDTLDGNGRSNYLLNANNVTMYKIEFGWYGAIGAKFYAYVPVDNGECRWVLVHTLVIENKLGQPCLEDPYFRFKYSVDIRNNASLREPQFIYKYGASCYIDGGDTGTVTQKSYSSGERLLTSDAKSILGIWPKLDIINKDGVAKANKKIIYPKSLSVSSSNLVRLDIVKCTACPGFGYGYNHGLQANESGRVLNIEFITLGRIKITTPGEYFTVADIGSKIIADGLWAGYINSLDTETEVDSGLFEEAVIERIVNPIFEKSTRPYPDTVRPRATGELLTIPTILDTDPEYPYPIRLSQYNAVAASINALSGSKIEINFMNPRKSETLGHRAEFLIGITDKKPIEELGELKWQYSISDIRDTLPLSDIVYGEYVTGTTNRDREGYEVGETNPSSREIFDIDNRIPTIAGVTGGLCSVLTAEILDKTQLTAEMVLNNPGTGEVDGQYYIKLAANTPFGIETILGGEVGLRSGSTYIATGITFTSEAKPYQDNFDTIYYAQISGPISGVSVDTDITIAFTPLRVYGTHVDKTKIVKFNPYPLYLVCMLRDNAIINSISIKETVGDTTIASTPQWLLNNNTSKYPVINNPAQDDLPPVNFVSQDRLDAAAIDTQLEQTLRPYNIIDSFFVAANETLDIDLTSIFGADRSNITPDILNLEATFIIGKTVDSSNGAIQLSLNTAEQ
jgi:hypothetical protein